MKKLFLLFFVLVFVITTSIMCTAKLDINALEPHRLSYELENINGIGPVLSRRIVAYRDKYMPVKVEWLDNVEGIGEKRLKLIRNKFRD